MAKGKKIFSIHNKFFVSTVVTVLILSSILGANSIGLFGDFFKRINLYMQNGLVQGQYSGNLQKKSNKAILVVEIDDKTLADMDRGGLGRWQDFRRNNYAKVIDNLKQDGAIVIGMDILFSEKSSYYKEDDKILADSIKKAGNVVLAFHKANNIYPIDELKNVATGIGDVYAIVNKINQNVYSVYPFYKDNKTESLSLELLDKYYEISIGEKKQINWDNTNPRYFEFYGIKIPYAKSETSMGAKELMINYLSNPLDFQKLSFIDVYNHKYDSSIIKDKIVLIGSTATALHDEYSTPLGIIPGVYTHTNAINTILNKSFLHYFDRYNEIWLLILFVYFITLLGIYDTRRYYFISSLFILIVLYFSFYKYSYSSQNTFFSYPVQFFFSIGLSFLLVSLYRYIYEDKGKRLLQNTLSQYLAEDLVKSILDNYEKVKLGGQRKENTIFFSDIAGFTSISEKMEPEELVHLLSEYLKHVSDDILNNNGFINKYEGDAVMALWGAFGKEQEQSYLACKGAIEQQKTITRLNRGFKEKLGFEISVRMGINRGDVIVGNIGSEGRKIEFTALGDNVNLASRLEGINKFYNTLICVSKSVKEPAGEDFIFRYLDKIKVKGKKNAVDIYELIGYKNEIPQEKINLVNDFEKALNLYFHQEFKDALKLFKPLSKLGDNPSKIFMLRCENFIKDPPGENWDSSWEFDEK